MASLLAQEAYQDDGLGEADEVVEQEFEVEDILRYRRNADGEEYFLVKWVGYPMDQSTWEPLAHMNENCRELIAKARALFAWRRPSPSTASAGVAVSSAAVGAVAVDQAPLHFQEDLTGANGQLPPLSEASAASPSSGAALEGELGPGDQPDASKRRGVSLAAAAAGPSKRPKLQAPSTAPTPPSTPPTPPPAPPPVRPGAAGDAKPVAKAAPREMKCICGATEKVSSTNKGLVACRVCNCALHPGCIERALNGVVPSDFVCPPCRLERVDEFHPPVGAGLLRHNYASCSSTFSLSFTAQATNWRKQQWAVHLRAVSLGNVDLGGPAWPHRVAGKLNGRQCVQIDPPKHLHVRREQCYNLTPLLRQGVNTLELRFTPKPDKPRDEGEEGYCVGVVLTRPRSVASIIARIRSRSTETVSSGRHRVEKLLMQVAKHEAYQDECMVTGNFGRTLRPLCPVSHCPIEEAAIGRSCNHVQVFDLQAYIAVNQRMRSLDKRWTCPVCSQLMRPDEVILDPFAQGILDTLRGDEDLVEAVVFNDDCTWKTVSAVKDDKDRKAPNCDEEAQGEGSAALIDLSDSE